MSTQTEVLFGNRLYANVTYSSNNDPQTLTATLSDSSSMSDADITSGRKPLADAATLSEVIAKLVERSFADSSTLTESRIMSALKVLSDSQTMADATALAGGKALSELVTLTETWITSGTKSLADSASLSESFLKAVHRAFADSETMTDAVTFANTKILLDTLGLSEALIKTVEKVFTETTTFTFSLFGRPLYGVKLFSEDFDVVAVYLKDAIAKEILKGLSESLNVADSTVVIHQTKGFLDFILLKSWLNIQLKRADPWTSRSGTFVPAGVFSLFGQPLFADDLYAANPTVLWNKQSADTDAWTTPSTVHVTLPLYAETFFAGALFGSQPSTSWTKPGSSHENWTNSDGDNNQES